MWPRSKRDKTWAWSRQIVVDSGGGRQLTVRCHHVPNVNKNEPLLVFKLYCCYGAVLGCEGRQGRGCMPYKSWNKVLRIRILWRALTLSCHAGHIFFCVIVEFDSSKAFYRMLIFGRSHINSNKIFCKTPTLSRSYNISSIYALVVGNMPQGKRHTSRTEPMLVQA